MTTVLAIDQGTSATKSMVITADNHILSVAEIAITPHFATNGVAEQEPWQLFNSVIQSAHEAIKQAHLPIDIITLANQGESVLAWEPDSGKPLTNILVWQDRRAETICQQLAKYNTIICQKTGLVLNAYFSAPKIAWIRQNLTTQGVVTTSDCWLLYQLTGEFVTDITTASRSLLLNIISGQWDEELLTIFNLQQETLPRIVANDEIVGNTTLFGNAIAVGGLIVDQQAALLAQHCLCAGEAKCTFGTGAFILANIGEQILPSNAGLALSVAWQQRNHRQYCFDGQVYTAASAVRWISELGLIHCAADLDKLAAKDSEGVISIPALAGLAAPWWQPTATASLSGMTLSTTKGHIVLAVLQGIVAQIAEMGELIERDLHCQLSRLRVDGGLTRSQVLMQCVADIMQIPVDVYPSQHATPLGAAALARMAINPQLTLQQAIIPWQAERIYMPQWSAKQAHDFRSAWRHEIAKQLIN